MTVKCKICLEIFDNNPEMLEHFLDVHLSKLKIIPCLFCDKKLANFEDLMHHVILDHKGMEKTLLENATLARQTKKQLGDYVNEDQKGSSVECNFCFEMFPNLDLINEHSKKEHNTQLNPEFIDKMRNIIESVKGVDQPICWKCNKKFLGVVFSKIDGQIHNICFNCYADYYGENALTRLTIGTPDDMVKKMRTLLK